MTAATGGGSLAFVGDSSRQASFHTSAPRWMPCKVFAVCRAVLMLWDDIEGRER